MTTKNLFLLCATIFLSVFFLSRTGFSIRQVGGTLDSSGKISNTISTTGDGKVYVEPDMVNLALSVSELDSTSALALDKVNKKISQALGMAKNAGLKDEDISTTNLSIYPEYDWSAGRSRLAGQRASQSLSLKIKNIGLKAEKATALIDELSTIENIQISSIGFDINDKTKYFTLARELAFAKAKQKAVELAALSGVSLKKPVSISEANYDLPTPQIYSNVAAFKSVAAENAPATALPGGQIDITSTLNILWAIE